jgi:hypothetical protein
MLESELSMDSTVFRVASNPLQVASSVGYKSLALISDWSGAFSVEQRAADARAIMRTHLASLAKSRERAYYSHRPFTTCAVSSLGKVKSSTSARTRSF